MKPLTRATTGRYPSSRRASVRACMIFVVVIVDVIVIAQVIVIFIFTIFIFIIIVYVIIYYHYYYYYYYFLQALASLQSLNEPYARDYVTCNLCHQTPHNHFRLILPPLPPPLPHALHRVRRRGQERDAVCQQLYLLL